MKEILGDQLEAFDERHYGLTNPLCDGLKWNAIKRRYEESGCGPHDLVISPINLKRFLVIQEQM